MGKDAERREAIRRRLKDPMRPSHTAARMWIADGQDTLGRRRDGWQHSRSHQATLEVFSFSGRLWILGTLRWSDWTGHPYSGISRGLTGAVVFVFLTTVKGANQTKLAQIVDVAHAIRTPYVVADCNMAPAHMETGWMQSSGQVATIVAPDVAHICTGRGRVVDCEVISNTLQPFRQGITLLNSTCVPHNALCLQLRSA